MSKLVFLPATEPSDTTYGSAPRNIPDFPGLSAHHIVFPHLVWYNEAVRRQAVDQILEIDNGPLVLIGFSKSGLGAWNITRMIPDRISATIIFDSPVVGVDRHRYNPVPFYQDDVSWCNDLPANTILELMSSSRENHKLIMISGEAFHEEMNTLSAAMNETGLEHTFLARQDLSHHWNSGWIEEGLQEALRP
ncbi:MAG: hypothetical protein HN368_18765 [Spirochaetales bacterium]|nr:hypothetical protein [Spirochaetales bacterium]